jgi:hypothetical protein
MAKQQQKTTTSGTAAGVGAATARAVIPVKATPAVEPVKRSAASGSVAEREEIARLAHSYWQARGCPLGSPDEDWLRAEAELQKQAAGSST